VPVNVLTVSRASTSLAIPTAAAPPVVLSVPSVDGTCTTKCDDVKSMTDVSEPLTRMLAHDERALQRGHSGEGRSVLRTWGVV
jgi:hypothetical protein